jgi:hypothetical protein
MSKATTKKAQIVYAWLGYGGIMKAGNSYITITTTHPETELDAVKKYYGDEFKGRWVKSTQSIESLTESLIEKLEEHKISGDLYKISTSDGVKILKEVFDCSKCSTMGVYKDKEDEEEEEVIETKKEEPKPKDKKQAKQPEPEKEKKLVKTEPEKESKKEESKSKPKDKDKKQTKQPVTEEIKDTKISKETKLSKENKKSAKIILSSSDEEEEDN